MSPKENARRARWPAIVATVVLTAACGEGASALLGPADPARWSTQVSAGAAGPATLRVTGRGIPEPLLFSLGTADTSGWFSVELAVPLGPDRSFTPAVFARDRKSHEAVITASVHGPPATDTLLLAAPKVIVGYDGIADSVAANHTLQVDTGSVFSTTVDSTTAAPGGVLLLTARLLADGAGVEGDTVRWGSVHPRIVTVAADGMVCVTDAAGTCGTVMAVNDTTGLARITAGARGAGHTLTVRVQ